MFRPEREYWIEQGCLHCKYRNGWKCMLDACYLKENNKENTRISTHEAESEYDCSFCPYKKHGGCYGYCIDKVLHECKDIWKEREKWRQKNG